MDGYGAPPDAWHLQANLATPAPTEFYEHLNHHQHMKITPSMSSLEALLSKLPSVVPADAAGMTGSIPTYCEYQPQYRPSVEMLGLEKVAKEEYDEEEDNNDEEKTRNNNEKLDHHGGESSSSMSSYSHHHHHYNHQQHFGYHPDLNVSSSMPNNGY